MKILLKLVTLSVTLLVMTSSMNVHAERNANCENAENYGQCVAAENHKKNAGGEEPTASCPGWSLDELNAIGISMGATIVNDEIVDTVDMFSIQDSETATAVEATDTGEFVRTAVVLARAEQNKANGLYFGVYQHIITTEENIIFNGVVISTNTTTETIADRNVGLTSEEFTVCKQQIIDHQI